jgi:hypothetical protein
MLHLLPTALPRVTLIALLAGLPACTDGAFTGGSGASGDAAAASPSPTPPAVDENDGTSPETDQQDAVEEQKKKKKKKKAKTWPPDAEDEDDESVDTSEDDLKPVPLPLDFVRLPDTAAWDNCLLVAVNGGEEQKLGCNHSGAAAGTITVMAKPQPACNSIRLRLTSNGAPNWTTADATAIATYFRLSRPLPGKIKVQANDNSDDDFNDLNLTIDGRGAVRFTIENSTLSCE